MKAKILIPGVIIAIIATIVVACKKDQYTTSPQISIKSVSGTVIPTTGSLVFTLAFTDKEGDIKDTVWVQKQAKHCPDPDDGIPISYKIPDDVQETKNMKGEIEINLEAGIRCTDPSTLGKDDTCYYRFWMKDRAQHVSDTVTSQMIILLP